MSNTERERLTVRFRKVLDADLRQAANGLTEGELSNLARDGLRIMLGIRTTKVTTVQEQPLAVPIIKTTHDSREQRKFLPSKPAVYVPMRKG